MSIHLSQYSQLEEAPLKWADINPVLLSAVTFLLFLHSSTVFQTSEIFLIDEVSDSCLLPPSVASYIHTHL